MLDSLKDIIVALIEQKAIANTGSTSSNIKEVNEAINDISKKLSEVNIGKYSN